MMRPVKFRKFIPPLLDNTDGGIMKIVPGTGQHSDFIYSGVFHQWGVEYEQNENGVGNFTMAIIELPDGTIEKINPSDIKFIDSYEQRQKDHEERIQSLMEYKS